MMCLDSGYWFIHQFWQWIRQNPNLHWHTLFDGVSHGLCIIVPIPWHRVSTSDQIMTIIVTMLTCTSCRRAPCPLSCARSQPGSASTSPLSWRDHVLSTHSCNTSLLLCHNYYNTLKFVLLKPSIIKFTGCLKKYIFGKIGRNFDCFSGCNGFWK